MMSQCKNKFHWLLGQPLTLMDVYRKRFDWPPREYVNLTESMDVSRGHVFVTGASENHYGFVYLPPANEVWGKVIFSEVCVKNSVHRGGSASVHAGIPPILRTRHTLPDQAPLRPGNHPRTRHPPPREQHLPGRACWEIRSTRGRYASYWNAILYYNCQWQIEDFPPGRGSGVPTHGGGGDANLVPLDPRLIQLFSRV